MKYLLRNLHRNQTFLNPYHPAIGTAICPQRRARAYHLPYFIPGNGPIDPGPAQDPNLFDILLSDIDHHTLHNREVTNALGHQYLSHATAQDIKPKPVIHGILYGPNLRPLITLATSINGKSHFLHYLFNTGSPYTYISSEVSEHQIRYDFHLSYNYI